MYYIDFHISISFDGICQLKKKDIKDNYKILTGSGSFLNETKEFICKVLSFFFLNVVSFRVPALGLHI